MKENRLGPRQWAFVVVAGGAVFALPFTQRSPDAKPEPPIVDVEATLLPEATIAAPASVAAGDTSSAASPDDSQTTPAWPTLPHSPFDDLVQQKANVPEARPTEEIVPMQPLRPWISAPNLSNPNLSNQSVTDSNQSPSHQPSHQPGSSLANHGHASVPATATSSLRPTSTSLPVNPTAGQIPNAQNSVALASPWRDDTEDGAGYDRSDDASVRDAASHNALAAARADARQVTQSYGQGRRQLPVNAGPADQYTYEEIAQKLNLPKSELVSAIVPADQVLPVPVPSSAPAVGLAAQSMPSSQTATPHVQPPSSAAASVPKSSVVLGRQPPARAPGMQIRFGQANEPTAPASAKTGAPAAAAQPAMASSAMVPLPVLPEERRSHMIMQPLRP